MLARRSRVPAALMKDMRGSGKRTSPYFTLRFRPNELSRPRFAAVVAAKVDRRATRRHQLKRQIAGFLATHAERGNDIVVIVQPAAAALPRRQLLQELAKIMDIHQPT